MLNRVDEMYEFFVHWSPHIPGTDDEAGLEDRGFIAMEASPSGHAQINEELSTPGCTRHSSKKWQVTIVTAKLNYYVLYFFFNFIAQFYIGLSIMLVFL